MHESKFLSTTIVLSMLAILTMIIFNSRVVLGEPLIQVSPTCGPEDFNIAINANGFEPKSNVAWKLVGSNDKVSIYGYFATNATGGFLETTSIDDVPAGTYKIYFGTDSKNDGKFDAGAPTPYANLTLPCPS